MKRLIFILLFLNGCSTTQTFKWNRKPAAKNDGSCVGLAGHFPLLEDSRDYLSIVAYQDVFNEAGKRDQSLLERFTDNVTGIYYHQEGRAIARNDIYPIETRGRNIYPFFQFSQREKTSYAALFGLSIVKFVPMTESHGEFSKKVFKYLDSKSGKLKLQLPIIMMEGQSEIGYFQIRTYIHGANLKTLKKLWAEGKVTDTVYGKAEKDLEEIISTVNHLLLPEEISVSQKNFYFLDGYWHLDFL